MRSFHGGEIFAMRDGKLSRRIFLLSKFSQRQNRALQEKQCNAALKTIHFFLYFFCLYICNWISELRSSCTSFCCRFVLLQRRDKIVSFCKLKKRCHIKIIVVFINQKYPFSIDENICLLITITFSLY